MFDFFNLKILAISHYISRSGTLYLHSLLDDHPEIATIPGTIDIVELLKVNKDKTADQCFQIFKKYNPKFFDTSKFTFVDKNSSSLWILGENKNDKILTNEDVFKKNFLYSLKNKEINPRNVLISLYFAYAKTHNKKIEEFKIILMHPHEKKTTLQFHKFFEDALFIIPIRNPLRAYEGIIRKVKFVNNLRNKVYYPSGQLLESALDIEDFYKKKLNMYFIKLEDLGSNLKDIMKKFSIIFKIKFNDTMLNSTFGGKKYWGNSTEFQSNHFDKSRHIYEINLPRKDKIILNFINKELMKNLNYEITSLSFYEKLFLPILIFLPMKDEVDFIKKFKFSSLLLHLQFIIFFIPKRILMIIICLANKMSKKYEYILKRIIN